MKASAEKSSTTTSTTAIQASHQPFFTKANGGNFFTPATVTSAPVVQMKMAVNKSGDKFEQEADKMADKAIRMPSPEPVKEEKSVPQADDNFQKKEEDKIQEITVAEGRLQKKEENKIIRKELGLPEVTFDVQAAIQKKTRGGEPLPEDIRQFAESRLRADFSMIRIHQDDESVAINQQLDSRAFTFKQHIFFGRGQFRPGSSEGKILLAHELVHTLQQGAATSKSKEQIQSEARTAPTESLVPPTNKPKATIPVGNIPVATITSEGKELAAKPKAKNDTKPSIAPKEPSELPIEPDTLAVPALKTAPKTPKEDPAFQKVIGQTRQTKKAQKTHLPPQDKNQAVVNAAHLPETEQDEYNDRKQHLESINQTASNNKDAKKKFTAEQFKELLKGQLDELEKKLPHSEDDAVRFKEEKPLEEIKNNVSQQVKDENQKVVAPIAAETHKPEPPRSGIAPQIPKLLVEEKAGPKPKPVNSIAAAPKPKADPEISMKKESRSLDELMEKNRNTEDQFAQANEPKFQKALKTKKEAQAKAAAAPQKYRDEEQQIIAGAQKDARKDANVDFGVMSATRGAAFMEVFTKQKQHEKGSKDKQDAVKKELERIYNSTKADVETIFTALSTYVDTTFNDESTAAKTIFEKNVEDELNEIYGWTTWDDTLFGADTEAIDKVFVFEKQRFLNSMDDTLNTIAQRIADDLNKAVERIQQGRNEAETFYQGLDEEQMNLAKDAMDSYRMQFDNLESTVDEKQTELARSLAESYKQNVDSLQQTFDKIKEDVSKSWIERAAEFLKEVAMTIYRLGELLATVLMRIAYVIGDILAHPIRFLGNLAAGIKQGFNTFMSNFDGYLLAGFFDWLRGKVGGAGIKLPAKFDTAGLFSLALQVIGLTYENFRNIAKGKLGEPVVAAIEKGVEGAQEVYKLLQLARQDVAAFWTHIKEVLASTVDEIFEKIKKTVLYETIKKVLIYIVTLFNPVGAFIKAAQAIYAGIRFLTDNIERIAALVNSFLDSVEMAVKGNVSGIAAKVIFGLQNAIVLGIDFLAKLLGLGNLAEKVRTIIKQLKIPVERAMGFVVDKVLKPVVGLVKKAGTAVKEKAAALKEKLLEWWKAKKPFRNKAGENHTLSFSGTSANAVLMISSTTEVPLIVYLAQKKEKKENKDNPDMLAKIQVAEGVFDEKNRLLFKQGRKTEDEKKHQENVIAALTEISQALMDLGGGDLKYPDDYPEPEFNKVGSPPEIAEVKKQSPKWAKEGKDTSGDHGTHGWKYIKSIRKLLKGDTWVQMHLVTAQLGGKAEPSNLIPAPNSVNSAWRSGIEGGTTSLMKRKVDGADKSTNVVWLKTEVKYYSPTESPSEPLKFASEVTTEAGLHVYKGGRKDNKADFEEKTEPLFSMKAQIPSPEFAQGDKASLNMSSGSHLRDRAGVDESIVNDIKRNRPYEHIDDFENKMTLSLKSRFSDMNDPKYVERMKAIEAVKEAVKSHKKIVVND